MMNKKLFAAAAGMLAATMLTSCMGGGLRQLAENSGSSTPSNPSSSASSASSSTPEKSSAAEESSSAPEVSLPQETTPYVDYEDTFSLDFSSRWDEAGVGTLNEMADLEMEAASDIYYLMVMRDPKAELDITFEEYAAQNIALNEQSFGASFGEQEPVTVAGNNGVHCAFDSVESGFTFRMHYYVFETEENFYILFAWCLAVDDDDFTKELTPILDSFQELGNAEPAGSTDAV